MHNVLLFLSHIATTEVRFICVDVNIVKHVGLIN